MIIWTSRKFMKVGPLQKKQNELFEIAESQQGYFTAKQAESVGFLPTNFQYHVKTGAWVREERGIYRLKNFPHAQVEAQYVHYALWSRDRGDQIQGVYSHETALSIYELSDVMPNKLHMSVPENFRKSAKTPKSLKLHYSDVPKEDREGRIGYFVTRPLRTLVDLMQTQETSEEHIEQALIQALDRGLILMREINSPRVPAEIQTKFNEWITHHRSKMKKAVGA